MTGKFYADLPNPAIYFPLRQGRFSVAPGFFPVTTSFGNGASDNRVFQIDNDFASFRANTLAARAERFNKYICFDPRFESLAQEVNQVLLECLLQDHAEYFEWQGENDGSGALFCPLTEEKLYFDRHFELIHVQSRQDITPVYSNALDALMSQVCEDIAIVALPEGMPDSNVALHVTAPSHWAPEEKIGKSFLQTHAPVPHFERVASASGALLETVRTRNPVVRFNWGIEFTDRWNLHPEPPPYISANEWNRRSPKEPEQDCLYLRIERQVLLGLRKARGLLFTIRLYVRPIEELSPIESKALRQTLLSMPPESRLYKGLPPDTFAEVVALLSDKGP